MENRLIFKELIFQNKMATEKNIKLNTTKQLIDLNGDKVNFSLHFEVESVDQKPFYATVITQKLLDSDEEPQFKSVENGLLNVDIQNDNGVYENYLLILKSNDPVECNVKINIKEIPLNPQIEKEARQQEIRTRRQERNIQAESFENKEMKENKEIQSKSESKSKISFKTILIIIVIIVGGILLWFFYFKKKNVTSVDNNMNFIQPINPIQPMNPISSPSLDENILSKINNIPLWN